MREDINDDRNVDADTNLTDLNITRLNNIETDLNTGKIDISGANEDSLFAANNLIKKTSDNLARSEAMVDDEPLKTDKTSEEKNENK